MKVLKSQTLRWMKHFLQIGSIHLLWLALATGCGPSGSSEKSGSDSASAEASSELASEVSKEAGSELQSVDEEVTESVEAPTQEAAVNAIKSARSSGSSTAGQGADTQSQQSAAKSTAAPTSAATTQSSQQQQQQSSASQSSGGQSSFPGMSKPAITQEEYRTLFEGIKSDLEAGEIDAAIAKAGIIAERNLSPAQLEALKQIALPVRAAQNALRKAETGSQKMTPQALETLKKELAAEALEKLKGVTL